MFQYTDVNIFNLCIKFNQKETRLFNYFKFPYMATHCERILRWAGILHKNLWSFLCTTLCLSGTFLLTFN